MKPETIFRIRAFRKALELAAAETRDEFRNLPRWCELKKFPAGSCGLASNFLARYLMDRDKKLYPCIIQMCGNNTFRNAESSTANSHAIVMLDGNYIDLTLDQFEEYPEYVPAEQIESAGILGTLISKILLHATRHVDIEKGGKLYESLSQSADELLAVDPEMLARERKLDEFSKTVRQLFLFDAVLPPQKEY